MYIWIPSTRYLIQYTKDLKNCVAGGGDGGGNGNGNGTGNEKWHWQAMALAMHHLFI
jgi:hypothetical protein